MLKTDKSKQIRQQLIAGHTSKAYVNLLPYGIRPKNKWIVLLLCLFLDVIGTHQFDEDKILLGDVYIVTLGFLGVDVLIDFIGLLFKRDPYFN